MQSVESRKSSEPATATVSTSPNHNREHSFVHNHQYDHVEKGREPTPSLRNPAKTKLHAHGAKNGETSLSDFVIGEIVSVELIECCPKILNGRDLSFCAPKSVSSNQLDKRQPLSPLRYRYVDTNHLHTINFNGTHTTDRKKVSRLDPTAIPVTCSTHKQRAQLLLRRRDALPLATHSWKGESFWLTSQINLAVLQRVGELWCLRHHVRGDPHRLLHPWRPPPTSATSSPAVSLVR